MKIGEHRRKMGGADLSPITTERISHRGRGGAGTEVVRSNLDRARPYPFRSSSARIRDFPFTQRGGYAINDLW